MRLAERQQFGMGIGRQFAANIFGVFADRRVDDGAAVARAGRRVDRIERRRRRMYRA